jgi:hypothetical protein
MMDDVTELIFMGLDPLTARIGLLREPGGRAGGLRRRCGFDPPDA